MNILDLKAADLGGAVGHVAASQLFMVMTEDDDNAMGPRTWFGSDPNDGAGIEQDVLDMARYVNGRDIPAEQLWRWAGINGIVVNEADDYQALPLARRLAFEIFTDTCMRAHHRLELAQLDARRLIPLGDETPAPGLKLEDSIFEPHGSLGEQEPHQKQFLEDQAAAEVRRLEAEAEDQAAAQPGHSLGAPIDDDSNTPAGLSVGAMEGTEHEEDAAGKGQEAGAPPAADPGAQGTVSQLADDGSEEAGDAAAGGADLGAAGEPAEALAEPLADARTDEGADGDGRGEAMKTPAKGKKSAKGKSTA